MYSDILTSIRTTQELELVLTELALLSEAMFAADGHKFDEVLKTKVRGELAEMVNNGLSGEGVDRKGFIEGLVKQVKEMKVVHVTVPRFLPQDSLDRIGAQVKTVSGAQVVADFTYDSSLMGGAQVDYEGRYQDYSLREKLEQEIGALFVKKDEGEQHGTV